MVALGYGRIRSFTTIHRRRPYPDKRPDQPVLLANSSALAMVAVDVAENTGSATDGSAAGAAVEEGPEVARTKDAVSNLAHFGRRSRAVDQSNLAARHHICRQQNLQAYVEPGGLSSGKQVVPGNLNSEKQVVPGRHPFGHRLVSVAVVRRFPAWVAEEKSPVSYSMAVGAVSVVEAGLD